MSFVTKSNESRFVIDDWGTALPTETLEDLICDALLDFGLVNVFEEVSVEICGFVDDKVVAEDFLEWLSPIVSGVEDLLGNASIDVVVGLSLVIFCWLIIAA